MMYVISIIVLLGTPILAADISTICSICECLQPSIVDCDNLELTEILEVEGDDIRRLSFSGNLITAVTKFSPLKSLKTLSLRYNAITYIENSAFAELPLLTTLDLSFNNLTSNSLDEDTFKGLLHETLEDPLLNLKTLNLSSNQLDRLTFEMFRRLKSLTSLSLRNNPLTDLSSTTAIAFSELPKLEELDLAYTGLQRLPSHIFADLRNLRTLDLTGNQFMQVPAEVNFVPSLENLILNNLNWTSISPGYLYESLNALESLHISHSPFLNSIENYAFANLTGLRKLIITHNPHLSILQEQSFSSKYNKTLNLEEVKLTHNCLKTLPEFAVEWSTISKLDLQHNPWQCDCNFEWIAKGLIPQIAEYNKEITLYIVCASPKPLMGMSVMAREVQQTKFVCYNSFTNASTGASIIILLTIFVGVLLLSAGTIFFSYALFKRTQSSDLVGSHIQYRRVNEPITPVSQ